MKFSRKEAAQNLNVIKADIAQAREALGNFCERILGQPIQPANSESEFVAQEIRIQRSFTILTRMVSELDELAQRLKDPDDYLREFKYHSQISPVDGQDEEN